MALLDFLRKWLEGPVGSNSSRSAASELREFTLGGRRHWVQVPKETFKVDPNKLTFLQSYVQREGLEVKRRILHLKRKYGENWRSRIDEVRDDYLRRQLARQELTIPVIVTPHPDRSGHFIVLNGVHTAFVLMEEGSPITAKLDTNSTLAKGTKTFSKNELRIDSSRR